MTVMILGTPVSQPTRSVEWLCLLTNIPYEFKNVRLDKGEHKSADFKKLNPNMKVPVMIDDGFILYESTAIARYLLQKYKQEVNIEDHWYPEDLYARAKINSYLDWHHTTFRPNIVAYPFTHTIGAKVFGLKEFEPRQIEAARVKVMKTLKDFSEQWLQQRKFIASRDQPSVADLFAYGEVAQIIITFDESKFSEWKDLDAYPTVREWAKRLESLDHFDKVHNGLSKFRTHLRKSKL
jgi:glutathione S-transferase